MNDKKSIFRRILNFRVVFKYISESAGIIKQGASLKDKLILFIYYLQIPLFIFKSLFTGKEFRELEEQKKYLIGKVVLKNKRGVFDCGNNILTVYAISENTEKKLYPYIDLESGIFIDVGAHIGKYGIWLGKNDANRIVAIEPEINNFTMLQENIRINGLTNIIAINKGAYSSKCNIAFHVTDKGDGTHSMLKLNNNSKEVLIPVDSLDNIMDELELNGPVSKIKIDVEGAELEVIEGAKRILGKDHPDLVIEIWEQNKQNLSKLIEKLQPYNYSFKQIDADNYYFS